MKNRIVQIYMLSDPITQEIRYVGKTNNIKRRYKAHHNPARFKNTTKFDWIKSLRDKNLKAVLKVIEECSADVGKERERFWIKYHLNKGCRLTNSAKLGIDGEILNLGNKTSFKKGGNTKKVVGYDIEGNITYKFDSGVAASAFFNKHESVIMGACAIDTRLSENTAWFYEQDIVGVSREDILNRIKKKFIKPKPKPNKGSFKKGQKSPRSRPVILNLNGKEREFESGTDCAKFLGVSQGTISHYLTGKCKKPKYILKFKNT